MDLLKRTPAVAAATAAQIRGWVTDAWPGDPPGLITVTQLRCLEAGCPPLETVVIVAPRPGAQHRLAFHCAADVLTEDAVRSALDALEATNS